MVGRWISFWDTLLQVSFRVCNNNMTGTVSIMPLQLPPVPKRLTPRPLKPVELRFQPGNCESPSGITSEFQIVCVSPVFVAKKNGHGKKLLSSQGHWCISGSPVRGSWMRSFVWACIFGKSIHTFQSKMDFNYISKCVLPHPPQTHPVIGMFWLTREDLSQEYICQAAGDDVLPCHSTIASPILVPWPTMEQSWWLSQLKNQPQYLKRGKWEKL